MGDPYPKTQRGTNLNLNQGLFTEKWERIGFLVNKKIVFYLSFVSPVSWHIERVILAQSTVDFPSNLGLSISSTGLSFPSRSKGVISLRTSE